MSREESIPVQETSPPTQPAVPGGEGGSPADMGPSANPLSKSEATPPMKQRLPELGLFTIPSSSRWFNWQSIHECEARLLSEFFDQTPSKNPTAYKYYHNSIIDRFRRASLATSGSGGGSSGRRITFTEVRRTIVGDVGSIRRVFDFLEWWGLINYCPSTHPHPPSSSAAKLQPQQPTPLPNLPLILLVSLQNLAHPMPRDCAAAASPFVPSLVSFAIRCYVRGNYRVGVNSSEFRRVEISETARQIGRTKKPCICWKALCFLGMIGCVLLNMLVVELRKNVLFVLSSFLLESNMPTILLNRLLSYLHWLALTPPKVQPQQQ